MVTPARSAATAFGRFFVACVLCIGTAQAATLAIGRSVRPHDVDVSLTIWHLQAEFIDEGEQPYGIPNRNRVVNFDFIAQSPAWRGLSVFAKAGLSSSRFSYSGAGNGYRNRTGFTGQNAGVGITYQLTPQIALQLQTVWMRYQQSDVPAYECFSYTSAQVALSF